MQSWDFVGLDGKKTLFMSGSIKFFVPPTKYDIPGIDIGCIGVFSGINRCVVIWANNSLGMYVFVDVYDKDVSTMESLDEIRQGVPRWPFVEALPLADYYPTEQFLEVGKHLLHASEAELDKGVFMTPYLRGLKKDVG